MARYRKISTFTWNDAKFRSLSDDGQLVWFLLLTHPHMTALGAMRATIPGLAAEKNWPEKRFRKAFEEPFRKGMVRYDERSALIWLPNFLKHNPPENPNVVKSWGAALDLLPECQLKRELIQSVKEYCEGLPKSFAEGLAEPFRKSMPIQEQEQEQEQEQDKDLSPEPPFAGRSHSKRVEHLCPDDYQPSETTRLGIQEKYPHIDIESLVDDMKNWSASHGHKRVNWDAELRTFAKRERTFTQAIPRRNPASAEDRSEQRLAVHNAFIRQGGT